MEQLDAIRLLITVARAAHNMADNTCEEDDALTVDGKDFDELSSALDALDELPEPGMNIIGTGPAKVEAFIKCDHGNGINNYCLECGRVHSA